MCRERHAGLTKRSTTRDVRDNATKSVEVKRCVLCGAAKPFHDVSWHASAAPTKEDDACLTPLAGKHRDFDLGLVRLEFLSESENFDAE